MGGEQAGFEAGVLENVRRYRAIASLCRQAAAFRPMQRTSLLQQAEDWERLAADELARELEVECTASARESADEYAEPHIEPHAEPQVDTRWWLPRREGLFAGLQA